MSTDLVNLSIAYLLGWKTIRDYAEWLAGVDWDNPGLDPDSLDFAGRMELLVTEVAEGLRPEADVAREASIFIQKKEGSLYTIELRASIASSANNTPSQQASLTVSQAGVLQSWNILPLQAPV